VVASINYRLSDEAKFPAQIEDCKAAIRFLRANARKHNIDPQKIGVAGSSAGGHLVALLGTSGGVKDLEGNEGNLTQSSRVQAVVDFCGPIDFFKQVEYYALKAGAAATQSGQGPKHAADGPVIRLLGGLPSEKKDLATKANPITHITRDDPPFLIIHGQNDKLVPPWQSQLLYDALRAAGIEARLILVPDAGHGMPGGKASLETAGRFFDRHLKNEAPAGQAPGKLGDYEELR
jgi:acetyl esterase/lipase